MTLKQKNLSFLWGCPGLFSNPVPTVDIIIEIDPRHILLIKRKNPPWGWAIPGGFVDYGESLEDAAIREAKEETGLDVTLISQMNLLKTGQRPRHHTIIPLLYSKSLREPRAQDDALESAFLIGITSLRRWHSIIVSFLSIISNLGHDLFTDGVSSMMKDADP